MQAARVAQARPGDVLAGKYRVDRVLGTGAMGMVVAATHLELHREVALKFMLPEMMASAGASDRFLREARAAAMLQSEHVCRVSDVGRLDSGAPYIVMEYLEGDDLNAVLRARGSLPVGEVVRYVLQTCEAMGEAHAAGIIHRDLKPENLFLADRARGGPVVKVLDFGISKASFAESQTQTSVVMGSPGYMSPEQWRSAKHVDARTDIYALGVILFQLLGGALPYSGQTMGELCTAVLHDPPRSLATLRPGLPAGLEAAIMRCLEKNTDRRFQTVGELAAALAPFVDREGSAPASTVPNRRPPTSGLARTTLGSSAGQSIGPSSSGSRRRWPVVATAIVAIATVVAFIVLGAFGPDESAPDPDARPTAAGAPAMPDSEAKKEPLAATMRDAAPKPVLPDASPKDASKPERTTNRSRRRDRRAKPAIDRAEPKVEGNSGETEGPLGAPVNRTLCASLVCLFGFVGCAQVLGLGDPAVDDSADAAASDAAPLPALSGLEVEGAALEPEFDPSITEYRVVLPLFLDTAVVTARADGGVSIDVDGAALTSDVPTDPMELDLGENALEIGAVDDFRESHIHADDPTRPRCARVRQGVEHWQQRPIRYASRPRRRHPGGRRTLRSQRRLRGRRRPDRRQPIKRRRGLRLRSLGSPLGAAGLHQGVEHELLLRPFRRQRRDLR